MRALLRSANRKGFLALWRISGKPMIKIVSPISQWTLPDGVTYASSRDAFVNGAGQKATVDWQIQPYTDCKVISAENSNEVILDIGGNKTINTTNLILLWSPEIEAAIKVTWGVVIGDKLCTVREWEANPQGAKEPSTIKLSLIARATIL